MLVSAIILFVERIIPLVREINILVNGIILLVKLIVPIVKGRILLVRRIYSLDERDNARGEKHLFSWWQGLFFW